MDRRRREANWLWQARLLRCLIDNASQKSPRALNLSPEPTMITWVGLDDDDGRLHVDLMRDCGYVCGFRSKRDERGIFN